MISINKKKTALILSALFLGFILLESCAASKPGFSGSKNKGKKVKSSGKMYR